MAGDGRRYSGGPQFGPVNPMRTKPRAIDDLRRAIASLPRATRVAMLEGIARNDIIVGAYSTRDGICPMLAAHRNGGRTAFAGFAVAWDRFAQRSMATKRARRATARELLVLKTHLEASLLHDETSPSLLTAAITEHEQLVSRHARETRADEADRRARSAARAVRRTRPGDPDRSRELRRAGGWAWTRLFRRYDEYERALQRLQGEVAHPAGAGAEHPAGAGTEHPAEAEHAARAG